MSPWVLVVGFIIYHYYALSAVFDKACETLGDDKKEFIEKVPYAKPLSIAYGLANMLWKWLVVSVAIHLVFELVSILT